jgi:DNA-binding transcriptional LysR family regulator
MTRTHRTEPFDLNLLPVFVALMETGSVSQAARRLGLTQSGTSRALARLRSLLGDPLFVREANKMVATARARALAPRIERLVEEAARLPEEPTAFEPSKARGTVRLASADFALHILLPRLLEETRGQAPGIDVQAYPTPSSVEALESGRLDFSIHVEGALAHPDLVRTPLFEEGFECLVREGHPATQKRLTVRRYARLEHLLVAPGGRPGGIVDTLLEERGVTRRVAVMVPSFLVVPALLERSDLVATLPRRLARSLTARWPLVSIPPPLPLPSFRLQLFWVERRRQEPLHTWFRQLMQDVASRLDES